MERKTPLTQIVVIKTLAVIISFLALSSFMAAKPALANMAANTQITNSARVDYNDGAQAQYATYTVTVTVALVPAAPTIAAGANQTAAYTGVDTQQANTFVLTATANGPDSYTLATSNTDAANTSGSGAHVDSPASPVALGATVTLSGSSTTDLYVPSDGSSNSSLNGIAAGDTVVVGGEARVVQSVTDNASGISHIILATALSGAPAAGVLVAEQQTVTVHVLSGTIGATGSSIVITNTLTAASTTDVSKTTTSAAITDTYTSGKITFTKYVRNVTGAVVGGGDTASYGGNAYYTSGVTAKPSEVLEYLLVINNAGTGSVTSAYITDGLPVGYVDFRSTPYSGSTAVTYVNESNAVTYLTSNGDTDTATWSAPTLTVYVGTGATSSAGGSLAAGATVRVLYQTAVK